MLLQHLLYDMRFFSVSSSPTPPFQMISVFVTTSTPSPEAQLQMCFIIFFYNSHKAITAKVTAIPDE